MEPGDVSEPPAVDYDAHSHLRTDTLGVSLKVFRGPMNASKLYARSYTCIHASFGGSGTSFHQGLRAEPAM